MTLPPRARQLRDFRELQGLPGSSQQLKEFRELPGSSQQLYTSTPPAELPTTTEEEFYTSTTATSTTATSTTTPTTSTVSTAAPTTTTSTPAYITDSTMTASPPAGTTTPAAAGKDSLGLPASLSYMTMAEMLELAMARLHQMEQENRLEARDESGEEAGRDEDSYSAP